MVFEYRPGRDLGAGLGRWQRGEIVVEVLRMELKSSDWSSQTNSPGTDRLDVLRPHCHHTRRPIGIGPAR
jgi:hypothetical protein